MTPAYKDSTIDNFLKQTFGVDRKASITNNVCALCQRQIDPKTEFTDALSAKEFTISGMCQSCQNKIFE